MVNRWAPYNFVYLIRLIYSLLRGRFTISLQHLVQPPLQLQPWLCWSPYISPVPFHPGYYLPTIQYRVRPSKEASGL